ncbi:RNA-binding protein [Terrimonas sp. NA20]|uniref:RNA-binding protein n=1 Tax=Terrimonas ginsenosidimutans TaxID=2908004 RepID=A0ABS9KRX1_9BACT|nr:RNA-binding protein [Terrimonas ginsenosidimutans]MCG2615083.1 RNA-binding protein [Terrimonas ginsenosidimutans]
MNMYVSNLDFNARDEDLKQLFIPFGEVASAKVVRDKVTGRSRGFGFVEMQSEEEGTKAMTDLNGKDLNGRTLSVSLAKQKARVDVKSVWM